MGRSTRNIRKKEKVEHKIIGGKTRLKAIGRVVKLQKKKYAGHIQEGRRIDGKEE